MIKLPMKLLAGAALATTLLAGCGGDSGGNGPVTPPPPPPPPMSQTISDVAGYIKSLFGTSMANSEPVGINNLTLVGDDKAAPVAVN